MADTQQQWTKRYIWLLIILVLWAIYCGVFLDFSQVAFRSITRDSIIDLIVPLFVISLFLERAQEVFISAWRDVGKKRLQRERQRSRAKGTDSDEFVSADRAVVEYTYNTRRASFLAGLGAGIVISVAGIRVLHPLITLGTQVGPHQQVLFDLIDIFLTGGLIGGGSDGIHKVMSLVLDFLDVTRSRVNASGNNPPGE
jgi:hypothetical protein